MLNGTIFTVYNQLYQFLTTVHETWLSVSAAKFVYDLIFGRSGLGLQMGKFCQSSTWFMLKILHSKKSLSKIVVTFIVLHYRATVF